MNLRELMEKVKNYWGEYERKAIGTETFTYIKKKVNERYYELLYDIMKEEIPCKFIVDVAQIKKCIHIMKDHSDYHKMIDGGQIYLPEVTEEERKQVEEILDGRPLMQAVLEAAKRKNLREE